MNDYLFNEPEHLDTIVYTNPAKYRMGWKITSPTRKTSNKMKEPLKSDHIDKKTYKFNGFNQIKKYNIYEKYPEYFPELIEQGDIDCCVPNCISLVYYYNTFKQGNHLNFRISRLFLYYSVRKIYNEMSDDSGSRIIDCIKILKNTGVPPEILHPYHEKFLYKKPSELSKKLAKYCKLLGFIQLEKNSITVNNIKKNLLENNLVICGIKIFENFNNKLTVKSGQVVLPLEEEELIGGHSIVIVGFDDWKKNFIFINSWGKNWGLNGLGFIPYSYITNENLADEFFILTKITNPVMDFFNEKDTENINKTKNKKNNDIVDIKNNLSDKIQLVKILLLTMLIIIYNM